MGLAVTVSAPTAWMVPPSGLVSVSVRASAVAVSATVTDTSIEVDETNSTAPSDSPVPEKAAEIPVWNPVPEICTIRFDVPCPSDAGSTDDSAGRAVTDIAASRTCQPPSALVRVSDRRPRAAPVVTVTDRVADVAVMPDTDAVTPMPENVATMPLWNPEPVTVTSWAVAPWPTDDGDTVDAIGLAVTVSRLAASCVPPSTLVRVSDRRPSSASAATVTASVAEVAVIADTVAVTPAPEIEAVMPAWNPVPVSVIDWAAAPWPTVDGDTDEAIGLAVTVNKPAASCVPPSRLVRVSDRRPSAASAATLTANEMEPGVE